jgi:hypothetical protein
MKGSALKEFGTNPKIHKTYYLVLCVCELGVCITKIADDNIHTQAYTCICMYTFTEKIVTY